MNTYFIGLILEDVRSPLRIGQIESYSIGFDVQQLNDFPYGKIYVYKNDEFRDTQAFCENFLNETKDAPKGTRIFISGLYSSQFKECLTFFSGTDILVLSIGTASLINTFPNISNGLSLGYNDQNVTNCMVNIMSSLITATKSYPSLYIIAIQEIDGELSSYILGFILGIREALDSTLPNGPQLKNEFYFQRGPTVVDNLKNILIKLRDIMTPYDILLYLGEPQYLEQCKIELESITDPYFLYLSDNCDGISLSLKKTIYVTIMLPYISYFSKATRDLFKKLYELDSSLANYLPWATSFQYDIARQILFICKNNLLCSIDNFLLNTSESFFERASLTNNWPVEEFHRPIFSRYFNIALLDEQWSQHIGDFNKLMLGSSLTQINTAAVQNICGFRKGILRKGGNPFSDTLQWMTYLTHDGKWIITKLNINSLVVDTKIKYQNNEYQSQNVGSYNIVFNSVNDVICSQETLGKTYYQLVTQQQTVPYPLPEVKIYLEDVS